MRATAFALLSLLLSALMAPSTYAFERTVDIAGVSEHLSLGAHLKYLADPDNSITAASIMANGNQFDWKQSQVDIPNLGLGVAPHWFVIRLFNSSARDWSGLLDMSYTMIDYLDFYYVQGQQLNLVAKVGDQVPFSHRLLANRNFLVPVTIPAQDSLLVIMRGESYGALMFPLHIWRVEAFFAHDQRELAPQLIFIGLMLALILYNFFLLLATRDLNYLLYVMSMISISLAVTSFHGILAQYLWPEEPVLNNYVLVGAISGTIFWATFFVYQFLDLKRHGWLLRVPNRLHSAVGVLLFIANFFVPYIIIVKAAAFFSLTAALLGLYTGAYLWYRGEYIARLYTIAWSALLVGTLILALTHFGYLPGKAIFINGQQVGAALEGILLSFALAYRINLERQKRFQAQEQLLRVQAENNQLLEQKVQERTLALVAANEKLQEASATDGLTQVKNRYFFEEQLSHEWRKNSRSQSCMSMLMIDGDHFKSINDHYGHLCGDTVLKQLAIIFKESVTRAGDFVARYGGEEFSILLCNTDLEGAMTIAERIRQRVESTPVDWEGKTVNVTVSIGVSCHTPSQDQNAHALLKDADDALYKAKKGGRNRVFPHISQ